MASKQLGKLRQWAGEVIASRDKSFVTDEFKALERDVELRRQGIVKLQLVSDDYRNYLTKKKECDALEQTDKYLAIDALGVVMIKHGEEFGDDSVYGTSLVSMGRAHCKVATLQEAFAMQFEDTYLAGIRRAEDDIKEFHAQRKKLDSRSLAYDAASAKFEKLKNNKKDKQLERQEAEDEYYNSKARYEETLEDVHTRMYAIQENEIVQLHELSGLLDLEVAFVSQYLEALQEVRANWVDEPAVSKAKTPHTRTPSLHRPRPDDTRFGSTRSFKSSLSKRSTHVESSDESADESQRPRAKSISKKSDAGSRPPSRPASRTSRKRSDSAATTTSTGEKQRKSGVAGWVSSMTGRGKKDKDRFAALKDDDDESEDGLHSGDEERGELHRPGSALSSSSRKSATKSKRKSVGTSPKASLRVLKPQRDGRKIAVALHDFTASSSDELSFKSGDHITVINEVIDGWWMGELNGKRGLFPSTYTEVISTSTSSLPIKPMLPQRTSVVGRTPGAVALSPQETVKNALLQVTVPKHPASELDEEHPFGDHNYAESRSPINGQFYTASVVSTDDDNEEERLVPPSVADEEWVHNPRPVLATISMPSLLPTRRATDAGTGISPVKKAPPPPPPRRASHNPLAAVAPPTLPSRPVALGSKSSHSSSTSFSTVATTTTGREEADAELTYSPFDNPSDPNGPCTQFRQHPFKPKGTCNNCFQVHG